MKSELRRALGLMDAIGIGLGSIIGAGLFVVTGVAAGVAGPAMLVGLVVAGLGATCNALSSADLAAKFPRSGGTYEYGNRLLNPWLGFSAGWLFLASKLAAAGTVAVGFGSYAAKLVPGLDARPTGVAAVVALVAANLFGIRKAGRLGLAIMVVTLASLVYFIVAVAPAFDASRLVPFAQKGTHSVLESAALMFFAYTGYARLATLGEEVAEPERTIPRAVIWSVAIASLLYLVVCATTLGAIGSEGMARTAAPLEMASRHAVMPAASLIIVVGGCSAMLGVLLSQILGISRMMFAMGRGRDLPGFLSRTNGHDIPVWAVLVTGTFLLAVAWFGKLAFAAAAASFTVLLYYGITNLAAIRLPDEDRHFPRWVAWTGMAFCIAMGASLSLNVVASGLLILALGILGRWIAGLLRHASSARGQMAP